jgi:hypothetical protein
MARKQGEGDRDHGKHSAMVLTTLSFRPARGGYNATRCRPRWDNGLKIPAVVQQAGFADRE